MSVDDRRLSVDNRQLSVDNRRLSVDIALMSVAPHPLQPLGETRDITIVGHPAVETPADGGSTALYRIPRQQEGAGGSRHPLHPVVTCSRVRL